MTIIAQIIADRMIMRPTRHPVAALGKERRVIPMRKAAIEAWTQRVGTNELDEVDLFVLKFQGTAGRAERSTYHPMDYWSDLSAELWSINPPGYGGSTGTASVKSIAATADSAYEQMQQIAEGRPIVVMGNSLGTVSALYLAAHYPVAGVILRNPPPLRQLIVGKYGWWNMWVGAWHISTKVPKQICSIRNARRVTCPGVFLSSGRDQVVPPIYHEKIFREYSGPYRLLRMEKARHATSLNLKQQRKYRQHLEWLRGEIGMPKPEAALMAAPVATSPVAT